MSGLKNLVWLTQLGFSIVSPLLLCILGAAWIRDRFQLGAWVIVAGLFLGLLGSLSASLTFYRQTTTPTTKNKKNPPPPISFNEHD